MRTKILAAVIVIAGLISVASCNWFSTSQKENSEFNMQGKWLLDSMGTSKDSSATVGMFLFALANKDSTKPVFEFNADSTYNDFSETDSVQHKYYVKDENLFLQEDSAFVSYGLTVINDSIIRLIEKDSSFIVLKRQ